MLASTDVMDTEYDTASFPLSTLAHEPLGNSRGEPLEGLLRSSWRLTYATNAPRSERSTRFDHPRHSDPQGLPAQRQELLPADTYPGK